MPHGILIKVAATGSSFGDTLAGKRVCKHIKNKIKTPVRIWIPEPSRYAQ